MSQLPNAPSYYKRNAWAFALDMGLFNIAMSFISSTTVLPTLIKTLSGSDFVVGIASGITAGAWMLPQLFVAGYVAKLKRKLPFVRRTAIITRPLMLLIAAAIWLLGASRPALTVGIVLTGLFLFFIFDAVVSVPWFDLMAKGLPPRRRGRIQGIAQVFGGLAGIGVGVFVRYALGDGSPWTFPDNYALLYALAFAGIALSTIALSSIHEPDDEPFVDAASAEAGATDSATADAKPAVEQLSTAKLIASLPGIIRQDRPFMTMIIVRLLMGFVAVASAFYVLYATGELGFAVQDVGLFISAQVAGQLAAGFVIGIVQDKWGPLAHIRVNASMMILPPTLALVASAIGPGPWMLPMFLLIYFSMGLYINSSGWPFFNWIMEHTDPVRRPLYIGASNTLGAVFMLAPMLGGWMVNTFSYAAVFAVAAVFGVGGLFATRWLKSTR